ncbi:hypothetical protein ABEI22_14015 [Erwinia billingiae]|uniref:hypothetical protein n=1 Tax=Erwinia billingiae TaxID=182337 RepID=UPI00320A8626
MNTLSNDSDEYEHILNALDRRAKNIRRNVFVLIYFVVTTAALVSVGAYIVNHAPNSPLSKAISAFIDSNQNTKNEKALQQAASILNNQLAKFQAENEDASSYKKNRNSEITESVKSMSNKELNDALTSKWLNWKPVEKSTSEKIAESISALVVSFSILMFVGFVMRAMLVFIKYYMQLGTDFENQKIAFMLSRGDTEGFSKNLTLLREHNVSFDKTPSMPQEKIIDKVIELTKNARGESGKN